MAHEKPMKHGRPIWLAALETGGHGCFFYTTPGELFEVAVPALKEGLTQTRERCLWILPPKISIREAKEVLGNTLKADVTPWIQQQKLLLISRDDWYPSPRLPFDAIGILRRGKLLLDETLKWGFDGLRIINHAISARSPHWEDFLYLEHQLDRKFRGKPVISLCGYSLKELPMESLDLVTSVHSFNLVRHASDWHLLPQQPALPTNPLIF